MGVVKVFRIPFPDDSHPWMASCRRCREWKCAHRWTTILGWAHGHAVEHKASAAAAKTLEVELARLQRRRGQPVGIR